MFLKLHLITSCSAHELTSRQRAWLHKHSKDSTVLDDTTRNAEQNQNHVLTDHSAYPENKNNINYTNIYMYYSIYNCITSLLVNIKLNKNHKITHSNIHIHDRNLKYRILKPPKQNERGSWVLRILDPKWKQLHFQSQRESVGRCCWWRSPPCIQCSYDLYICDIVIN